MNKTWTLTKILWKNGSGVLAGSGRKAGRRMRNALIPLLLIVAFLPLALSFATLASQLYDGLARIHQEGLLLGLGLSMVSLVIFVFGVFYVINVYYFSQDVEHLLPLPLKPSQILTAKFAVTLLYEYLTELITLLPLVVTFGIKSGAGIAYYVYAAVIFLTLPVIPLILASVIAMLVMRFTNVAKNKDRYRMIGGVIAVLCAFGFNFLFQRFSGRVGTEDLQQMLLGGDNSFLHLATRLFPSAKLGAMALLHATAFTGFVNLVLFLAVSALFYVIFVGLGEWLYFKGVMGISESTARRKQVTREQLDKLTGQNSPLKAYTIKELKILFRTPAFFMNCVLMNFLWPVLICIPVIAQSGNLRMLGNIPGMLQDSRTAGIVLAVSFAIFLFVAGANNPAATAISREGQSMFVIKFLPVPYATIIISKVIPGFLLSAMGVILMAIVAAALLGLPVAFVILMLAVGLPGVLFVSFIGMLFDLKSPKLHWDNEQKAVKQNVNSLFCMLVGIAIAALTVLAVVYFRLTLPIVFFGLFLLFVALDIVLYCLLITKGTQLLGKIEP